MAAHDDPTAKPERPREIAALREFVGERAPDA